MLQHPAIQVQKTSHTTERIGTEWKSARNFGLVVLLFSVACCAIILPLVFIDNEETDASKSTSTLKTQRFVREPIGTSMRPPYTSLEHPTLNGLKIFKDQPSIVGCPHGSGVSVLFDHVECKAMCNVIENCIGYNFNTVTKFCVFYSNFRCLNALESDPSGETIAYLKN